jgi:hypothetical protein
VTTAELEHKQRALFVAIARGGRDREASVRIRREFLVALRAGAYGSSAPVLPLVSDLP